jgi:p-aminobenzoyl-glutamate transporter AbgT
VAFAAYLVYEERVRHALESYQGDAAINEQENGQRADQEPRGSKTAGLTRLVGIVLFAVAVLFWVAAPAVLLTPLSTEQKAWTSSAFLILGEVAFWVAAVALGHEVFRRYRRYLDPRGWLGKKRL